MTAPPPRRHERRRFRLPPRRHDLRTRVHVEHPAGCAETNTIGTLLVLEEAARAGVKKLVLSTSAAIYGNNPVVPKREEMIPEPASPYAISKLDGEYYCRLFTDTGRLPTVALRYFNVFGPRQNPASAYAAAVPIFIHRALRNEPITIHGDGAQTRDFISVHDVARANAFFAVESPLTGVFNVARGGSLSILDLARLILRLTGSASDHCPRPRTPRRCPPLDRQPRQALRRRFHPVVRFRRGPPRDHRLLPGRPGPGPIESFLNFLHRHPGFHPIYLFAPIPVSMQTRVLGNSDLHITPIGFGAWAIGGGDWQFGWGDQDDRESIAAIHRALELEASTGSTPPPFTDWDAPRKWSRAPSPNGPAPSPYVFTKCGMVWGDDRKVDYCLRAASVRRECEQSLRRLSVDTIDLYQVHWPADDPAETAEGWRELAALQREGKIRWIGASNFNLDELQAVQHVSPVTSLQPPYSLIRRETEIELLPYCQSQGIGVICYSPMASGLLSGAMTRERIASLPLNDWRSRNPEFQEPRLTRNLAIAQCLRDIGRRHGVSAAEAAIAWVLRHPAITGAIVGARNPGQVEGFVGAADFRLAPVEIEELYAV